MALFLKRLSVEMAQTKAQPNLNGRKGWKWRWGVLTGLSLTLWIFSLERPSFANSALAPGIIEYKALYDGAKPDRWWYLDRAPFEPRTSETDCSNADNSASLGPVRNQSDSDWCFAYVASDVLSVRTGKRLSALDMAIGFYRDSDAHWGKDPGKPLSSFAGGFQHFALLSALKNGGVCSEESLPSDDPYPKTSSSLLQTLRGIEAMYGASSVSCSGLNQARALFPKVDMDSLVEALRSSSSIGEYVRSLAKSSCDGGKVLLPSSLGVKTWSVNYKQGEIPGGGIRNQGHLFFHEVDQTLANGEIIGVSVDFQLFRDPESPIADHIPPPLPLSHEVSIVGREFKDGQCGYLLRNSWGPDCGGYTTLECRNGYQWVPERLLKKYLFRTTTVTEEE